MAFARRTNQKKTRMRATGAVPAGILGDQNRTQMKASATLLFVACGEGNADGVKCPIFES